MAHHSIEETFKAVKPKGPKRHSESTDDRRWRSLSNNGASCNVAVSGGTADCPTTGCISAAGLADYGQYAGSSGQHIGPGRPLGVEYGGWSRVQPSREPEVSACFSPLISGIAEFVRRRFNPRSSSDLRTASARRHQRHVEFGDSECGGIRHGRWSGGVAGHCECECDGQPIVHGPQQRYCECGPRGDVEYASD